MTGKRTLVLMAAALLIAAPAVHGAGFLIYEHGAAAMAMAGAFTSVANDPSAIWHNPAGMAWLDGTQIMLGATFIVPVGSVTLPNFPGAPTINQEHQLFYPPHVYITHKFSDRITAGVGFMAPYGLGTKWPNPNQFPLRYAGTSNDMKTFFINPAVSYKISDKFALGVGVAYTTSSLTLAQNMPSVLLSAELPFFDIPAELKMTGSSFTWNAGILYREKSFSLGLNYRGAFDINYSGTVALSDEFNPLPGIIVIPTEGTAKTTFEFPDILTAGVSFNLTSKLLWSTDLHIYFWHRYDVYTIEVSLPGPLVEEFQKQPNWKDSYCLRTGFQYQATDKLALRIGGFYDKAPQPAADMDPNLPDANRWAATGGIGYKMGKFVVNLTYHFEHFFTRTDANPYMPFFESSPNPWTGTWKTTAHLFGVSLGYNF